MPDIKVESRLANRIEMIQKVDEDLLKKKDKPTGFSSDCLPDYQHCVNIYY